MKRVFNIQSPCLDIKKDIQDKIKNKYEIMDPETNEKREIKYQDFAILIDRSSSFETYKKIFEY